MYGVIMSVGLMSISSFLTTSCVISINDVANDLSPPGPVLIIDKNVLVTSSMTLARRGPKVVFRAFFQEERVTRLFIFPIVIVSTMKGAFFCPTTTNLCAGRIVT